MSLLQMSIVRILTIDTLGSMEEILDGTLPPSADPIAGTSRGAMSQAWSVSEFIRAVHSAWFGLSPSFATTRVLDLTLILPGFITTAKMNTPMGEGTATVSFDNSEANISVTLLYQNMGNPFDVALQIPRQGSGVTARVPGNIYVGTGHTNVYKTWEVMDVRGDVTWYKSVVRVNVTSPDKASVTFNISI